MIEKLRTQRALLALTCLPILVIAAILAWALRPAPRELVIWSCGGNYESLKEYVARFEKTHRVRVTYTAAPVMYLLETALRDPDPPDIIVGRAGPGWIALKKAAKLAYGPEFFAIDPFVIAVAKGNPCAIRSVEDLGRPGIRVVQATHAMRPKGKVPALFMSAVSEAVFPGLVERWDANTSVRVSCGRKLLDPIAAGSADAAIVPKSLLTCPGYRGKCQEVEIPAEHILAMKKGRPSMPQCAGVLPAADTRGRGDLARQFVDGLQTDVDWLHRHGYLALTDQDAQHLRPLLEVSSPKDMPGWQSYLAEKLEEYEVKGEAPRRHLKVFYTFGPNGYTARALCNAARLAHQQGNDVSAALDWRYVLENYPPKGPVEYDSSVLHAGGQPVPVERKPYEHWLNEAREGLAAVTTEDRQTPTVAVLRDPVVRRLFPIRVIESDPPKNGKRELGLGLHLLVHGDTEFATRDLLKVVTLCHGSRFMADAEYLLGICAQQRGLTHLAQQQWQTVLEQYPQSKAAGSARETLLALEKQHVGTRPPPASIPAMPPWQQAFDTHAERGMTYGMRLYQHHLPLFAYKEMMKIACGIYAERDLDAEARYRAGIACEAFTNNDAATHQWTLCARNFPKTQWAALAREKLSMTPATQSHQPELGRNAKDKAPVPKSGPAKRFRLAEEFRQASVHEDGQIIMEYLKVLTVARPPLNPKTKPMLAAARFHLATCLIQEGYPAAAREHLTAVTKAFGDTVWGERAQKALEKLPASTAGATPDASEMNE